MRHGCRHAGLCAGAVQTGAAAIYPATARHRRPDLEPQVTIKKEGGDRVEEYRIKGRLYMIRVTPPHGRPYYLIDTRGDGQLRRFDELSPDLLVPLWVVKEF